MSNKNDDSHNLTTEDTLHIAQLANLKLKNTKVEVFQQELSSTLEYIAKLDEVDTSKVEPTYQVTDLKNVWRQDVVKPSLTQAQALQNAKRSKDGYFMTDKVL